jgi:hypothetical protein
VPLVPLCGERVPFQRQGSFCLALDLAARKRKHHSQACQFQGKFPADPKAPLTLYPWPDLSLLQVPANRQADWTHWPRDVPNCYSDCQPA